jgi:hypothetical protein
MQTHRPPLNLTQPKALLVDDRLRRETGGNLIDTVEGMRAAGFKWEAIAEGLSRWTDLVVSRQSVQQWHASWTDAGASGEVAS